ncbi:MAG: hypothetical protein E7042_04255 [Lentisphaerae bacterium]|nr:hypothetical protein [Lentisphaerota bacterium]
MMNKREQRGVALLFALGMLTILLVTGMAFVANALTAQKVAANNSARSQARMFAQSALSRAMASVMVYQYQYYKANTSFPESFANIYSCAGSGGLDDGLQTTASAKSLMNLPMDDTVVAKTLAKEFNNLFLNSRWQGQWVNFYDNTMNSSDRQIIGRAAWQVLSNSPQILAPVFLSGHLQTDGFYSWTPRKNRWGREIDEIYLPTSGSVFSPAVTAVTPTSTLQDYEIIYNTLGFQDTDAAKKRFIDKWLCPDIAEGSDVLNPTPIIPETYYYQESANGKKIQVLRFNISEVSSEPTDITKYASGANTSSDPWYLRFGLNSSNANSINNANFLNKLANDGAEFQSGDEYDFDLSADDRPSLPFLRRIGNVSTDNPTYRDSSGGTVNRGAWRRQIAANFNDYCDADSVPTSDKPATTWMTLTGNEHPNFTGNEKTPYLYELGFRMGFYPAADAAKSGVAVVDGAATASGSTYSTRVGTSYIGVAPIVKLANVYNFDPTGFSNFTAGVTLGEVAVKFKPSKVSFKVEYTTTDSVITTITPSKVAVKGTGYDMNFNELSATVADNSFADQTLSIADADLSARLGNTNGENPYPLLVPENSIQPDKEVKQLTFANDAISFNITSDILKSIGNELPEGATINSVTLTSIDAVEMTEVTLNVKRAYLSASINGSASTGLDYVRTLSPRTWTSDGSSDAFKLDAPEDEKKPGFYLSLRNYDPRQNLYDEDWSPVVTVAKSADIRNVSADDTLQNAMCVGTEVTSGFRGGIANTGAGDTAENDKFLANHESDKQDVEVASEPGWRESNTQTGNQYRLSTAFIRNAPMMSPWEIGLIHRGVRWQTLNIKNACDPDNNSQSVRLTAHAPNNNNWTLAGTSYAGGDGGILDQIKMTEQCATYGKININKLRDDHPEYDSTYDPEIARVLFNGIRRGQSVQEFYDRSKRNASDQFNPDEAVSPGIIEWTQTEEIANRMVQARHPSGNSFKATSRAQFLDYVNGSAYDLSNAFTGSDGADDAAQEEVIGKTINLLDVEPSTPSQIQMVIVAQAIRDVGGVQHRKNAAGNNVSRTCEFGTFDYDSTNNIYYDEIIGEVKMFVTLDRDINTGRMTVRRIDYLE